MRFLSWVAGRSWQAFDVGAGRRTALRKRERATLQKAANLLARLEATRDERMGRALLAAAISVVHGIPLESVLSLRMEEVSIDAELVVLWSDDRAVRLATTLSAPFARLAPSGGKHAFPGRNPNRPASIAGIMHHAGQARSGRARIVGAAR